MRSIVPRLRGGRNDGNEAVQVAALVVQTAMQEYSALREEVLQTFQRMVAAATLALAIAGAGASLVLSQNLDGVEWAVLLLASMGILVSTVAAISMSLHVTTITRWLQHIARDQIRPAIADAARGRITVPADLLGWDDYQRNPEIHGLWARLMRRLVWLAVVPLPLTAAAFETRALQDLLKIGGPNGDPLWCVPWLAIFLALAADVGVVLYSVVLLLQIAAVRRAEFSGEDVIRPWKKPPLNPPRA
jgi:hypothetical protein